MGFDLGAHSGEIERDGYTILHDFMDAARLAEVRRVLSFYLGSHSGRNPESSPITTTTRHCTT